MGGAHVWFLSHRGFLWLKVAVALTVAGLVAYLSWSPVEGPNGGTAVGYGLGGLGATLILWLAWLGVRKRSFAAKRGRIDHAAARAAADAPIPALRGWTSAHVYLGLALLGLATLHTGFEFGWNIHTLAYALMVVVILSGAWMVIGYARYPDLMSANLKGESPARLRARLADADAALARLANRMPDSFVGPVRLAAGQSRLGGGALTLLSGSSASCAARRALEMAQEIAAGDHGADAKDVGDLVSALSLKASLLQRLRLDNAYRARMELMLWIHVPVTVALIAALTAHVISVFWYW
jgi:hypothetical protein